MSDLIAKHRRAVSPIVTTLFLFGVILAGISVSLGIIYPAVSELNDQITLETAGSSLQTLDNNLQNLMLNGVDSEIFTEYDVGIGGAFQYNNEILSTLTLLDGGIPSTVTTLNNSRLQIQNPVSTDFIEEGQSQYFGGAGNQDFLFLNSTTRRLLSWSIINQTRPLNSDIVTSSLSYRNIMSKSFDIIPSQLFYNLTINVHVVNITLSADSRTRSTGTSVGISMRFLGSTISQTNWVEFSDDLSLVITTQYPESGSVISTERPISAEAPVDPTARFFVRYSFNFHQIQVTI